MRQELQLALKCQFEPPMGMSFDEPEAMKQIEKIKGRPVIRISKSELSSYAKAILSVYDIIQMATPNSVLISMRGALPIFRSVMQYGTPYYLSEENNRWRRKDLIMQLETPKITSDRPHLYDTGARWRIDWGVPREINHTRFRAVKAPTSYFLNDLSGGLERSLKCALDSLVDRRKLVLLFIDTSVTGTKLGWFMPQFLSTLGKAARSVDKIIHVVSAIVHHDRQVSCHVNDLEAKGRGLYHTRIDIGVESLITEDSATLLGAPCKMKDVAEKAQDVIRACNRPKRASIMVDDRFYDINDEATGNTACLFARIAANEARQSAKTNGC
jgi:hypothetical protein